MTLLTTLTLGFLLGLKHAFDADHLVAISTVVTRERSVWRSLWVGLSWGLGHTFTLLVAGLVMVGLKQKIPTPVGFMLEGLVGVVLIGLGLQTLFEVWRRRLHAHRHTHAGTLHIHFHTHADTPTHAHSHPARVGLRPVLIGMVHGLAGSAALMILVLATIPSPALGVVYMAIFGCGSIVGMGIISLLMGVFFSLATDRLSSFDQGMRLAVGMLSTACGGWIMIEVGFLRGLFSL